MALAFKASLDGIAHVLRDRPLSVPTYQRTYSWGHEEVQAFWSDILELQTGEPSDAYFLGTIVLTKSADRAQIVDGQQRLATVTMLLAAIRNAFLERGDEQRATVLERDYVAFTSLRAATLEPRLRMGQDDAYFSSAVVERPRKMPPPITADSHSRIRAAFELLTDNLRAQLKDAGKNWSDVLFRWTDILETRVQVILIEAPSSADAYTIFETLNDRGLDLTVADLLKNYLFSQAADELSRVQTLWAQATDALQTSLDEAGTISFLRHYWSSVNGPTRERELYRQIRGSIRAPRHAVQLLEELNAAAPFYAALNNPNDQMWTELGGGGPRAGLSLTTLGIAQNRPLLLAGHKVLGPPELLRLVEVVNAWSLRGIIVGGIGGGVAEKRYSNAAVALRKADAPSLEIVVDSMSSLVPGDEDFELSFATYRPSRVPLARYCLIEIERVLYAAAPELLDAAVLAQLIPTKSKIWADADQARRLSRRLGNLALMEPNVHRQFDTAPDWATARAVLEKSKFASTRDLAFLADLSPRVVEERQAIFARSASKVWPRLPV